MSKVKPGETKSRFKVGDFESGQEHVREFLR